MCPAKSRLPFALGQCIEQRSTVLPQQTAAGFSNMDLSLSEANWAIAPVSDDFRVQSPVGGY